MSVKKIAMAAAGAAAEPITEIKYVGGYTTTINGTTANTNVTLTSLTGGIASAPAAGDLVVVYFAVAGASTSVNLAISGYTEITESTVADSSDVDLLVAYKLLTADDTSFTITGGTGDANDSGAVAVQVFRYALAPTQSIKADTGNTAIANPAAVTPTTAGSWIIAGGGAGHTAGACTFSSSDLTNFISTGSNQTYDATVGMGYKVWTSGAFDPAAFTFSGTDSTAYASTATTFVIQFDDAISQQSFTTAGTSSFVVPARVTSISVVCVGGGEGGGTSDGGNGGNLRYVNNISVTPFETLTVVVGGGGIGGTTTSAAAGGNGGASSVSRGATILCGAGGGGVNGTGNVGTGGEGGTGGSDALYLQDVSGLNDNSNVQTFYSGGGGGGAGGYSGNGGNGASNLQEATSGSGGGGGGGGMDGSGVVDLGGGLYESYGGAEGGGVGINGQGSSGAGGLIANVSDGSPGSGGVNQLYGGGGRGGSTYWNGTTLTNNTGSNGARGAVKIIWPGDVRQFPSTRTTDE